MSENPKKLFLLDAFALIYRSYFAFINNPRVTSKGMDTSAIFGFVTTMLEVLEKQKPTHIAVVYDTPSPTVRHIEYKEYKANRDETPEAIKISVPYIARILEGFNIPFIGVDGYEADDVIGTMAKMAEKEGFEVFMMTPDKDFGQLVSENIKMFKPGRSGNPPEVMGVEEVKEKFGIERVDQVIDYLGMMGDSVDNIPGLPGVGAKTAQKLLAQYDSMENMFEHADEIKGKLGEKIRDNKELGTLSKWLARIIIDVPVEFNAEDLKKTDPDTDKLTDLFTELEFRALMRRVVGNDAKKETPAPVVPSAPGGQTDLFSSPPSLTETTSTDESSGYRNIENKDHFYQLINHPIERKLLLKNLLKQKSVCFDTETTSLDITNVDLGGIAFSYEVGKAYYLNVPQGEEQEIAEEFRSFFEDETIEKIGQNIKYDISVIKNYGIEVKGPIFDTMLAHYLIQPDMRHNMDVLAETYLNYQPVSIETLIGKKGKNQLSMRDADLAKVKEYAGEYVDITLQLKHVFEEKLNIGETRKIFEDIEVPLARVLSDMEMEGITLDVDSMATLSKDLETLIVQLEKEIKEISGEEFNIASPKQLGEVLFEKMKLIEKPKKTKSGQYSTSEDILVELAKEHEIAQKILDFRQMVKLKSTYVDALPTMVSPTTNRIHTSFNQAVAATGRLSSNNPNLQNIPIRTEKGKEVRRAFIPRDKDHVLVAADYSQIELRLIAELSEDETMMDAFIKGEDIHAATAARVFDVPLEEVTREQRGNAKTVNFGIIYGVSAFGLSQQTTLSRSESSEIIKSYFQTYPGIRDYIENQKIVARENGFVETMLGRRRYLNDINSRNAVVRSHAERNAVNAPIQGTAADIIKLAMIKIQKELKAGDFKTKMILQVHDELVFDTPKNEVDLVKPIIREAMETAIETKIPLIVDFGQGDNWLEAH